jgi:hypothetical protein
LLFEHVTVFTVSYWLILLNYTRCAAGTWNDGNE